MQIIVQLCMANMSKKFVHIYFLNLFKLINIYYDFSLVYDSKFKTMFKILMNLLRGDLARLQRCTHPLSGAGDELPRVKPLYYSYEKEIVMYAR